MDSREVTMDRIKAMLDKADDKTLREIERMVKSWIIVCEDIAEKRRRKEV